MGGPRQLRPWRIAGDLRGGKISGLSSAAPAVPVLFRLAPDRRRCRVLDLQPVIGPTGAVGRAEALRHDALAAERAGVLEEHRAVAEVMLVEGDALLGAVQKLRQEIFAFLDGCVSQVVASSSIRSKAQSKAAWSWCR
jgi:hypothetical protein